MRLVWSRRAAAHVDANKDCIARDDPLAARAFADRLIEATERLKDFPLSGRPGRVGGTRELIVPHSSYLIVYAVGAETVSIAAVLHGALQWPDRFPSLR